MKKINQNSINFDISEIDDQILTKKKCFNIKCIILFLISIIILLLGTTITLLILYLKNDNSLKIYKAKVKDLEILIENLKNRISILEKENLECNASLNDYKTKLGTCEIKVNDLELLIENLKNRISILEKENLECNTSLNDYKTK